MKLLCLVFFVTIPSSLFGQQHSTVVLPRQDDTLQANFYAIECSENLCAIAASGYNWSTHTASLFLEVSTDRGDSWLRRDLPFPVQKDELLQQKPRAIGFQGQSIWVAGDSGMLIVSTDFGQSWGERSVNRPQGFRYIYFRDDKDGLALGVGGMGFKTDNGGITWTELSNLPDEVLYSGRILATDSLLLWGDQQQMYLWVRNEIIDTLYQIPSDPTNIRAVRTLEWRNNDEVLALAFHQRKFLDQDPPFVNTTFMASSTNGGKTFSTVFDDSLSVVTPLDISIFPSGSGIVTGVGRRFLRTSNWGMTWFGDSLEASVPYDKFGLSEMVAPSEALILAFNFAQGVILKTQFGTAAVQANGELERLGTHLYPNPSSGEINIQKWYTYDEDVRIINVLGEEALRTKINWEPGTSTIDCSKLPNGTYTILIKNEGRDLPVGRFILMK